MREVTDRQKDRQKDRHTDTGDFIICAMLCYSNGTDNYCNLGPVYDAGLLCYGSDAGT